MTTDLDCLAADRPATDLRLLLAVLPAVTECGVGFGNRATRRFAAQADFSGITLGGAYSGIDLLPCKHRDQFLIQNPVNVKNLGIVENLGDVQSLARVGNRPPKTSSFSCG